MKVRNGCYVCWIFFFFFSRNYTIVLPMFYGKRHYENDNQTPPSTAENDVCSGRGNYYLSRRAAAGLRQSNSHPRPGPKCSPAFSAGCSGEKDRSVIRRGKNIRQPEAFLDLGQSDVFYGTAPTPMAVRRAQALKK